MMARCRSLLIAFLILWLILRSKGSPEIGFSLRLTKDVIVPGSKVTVISHWERGYSLLFEYGIKLTKGQSEGTGKERAILPFSGLFLATANLIIEAKQDITLRTCIAKNICQETAQNEHTITFAIQDYFLKNTVISMELFAEHDFSVLKDSSFAVQYLGPISRMTGFLALLPKNRSLEFGKNSNYARIAGWKRKAQYAITEDSQGSIRGLKDNSENLAVHCSGLYLVAMTLSFIATKDVSYEVRLISRQTEITYRMNCNYSGTATVSVLKSIEMRNNDTISVQLIALGLNGVTVLKGSRLTAVYIGKSDPKFFEFTEPLKEESFASGVEERILTNYLPQKIIKEKNIKQVGQENYQIAMPKHGVYFVALHLNVEMNVQDTLSTQILVYDRGLKAFASIYGRSAVIICGSAAKDKRKRSIVLTGILALETHDFIKVSLKSRCKNSFRILKDSWISFTAVRSHDFAASFHINRWTANPDDRPRVSDLVLNATASNIFLLNTQISSDGKKFKCPLNGIYMITMNLIISAGQAALRTTNIRVLKRNTNQNIDKSLNNNQSILFDANITIFNRLTAANPTFVCSLKENDILSFHILGNVKLEVHKESSIFISLIDFVETGRTFLSKYGGKLLPIQWANDGYYSISSWIPITQGSELFLSRDDRKAPAGGFYLVSCHVQLECTFNNSVDSLELSMFVYFNDKDREFGLKDRVEVMKKGNGTDHVYLSVVGVLQARKDAILMTSLRSSKYDIDITILSSELSVSLHRPSEDDAEIYRSLQSSTKLLSFKKDNWISLDRRIYSNGDGEFKSNSVEFLGLRFHAQRSILAFVSATTVLHGVDGIVEYGVVVYTGSQLTSSGLSTTVEVNKKQLKTLKWTGLVYMEPWQQIGLVVRMMRKSDIQFSRTSWSSLTFMALSFPESADRLQPVANIKRLRIPSDSWYVFVRHTKPSNNISSVIDPSNPHQSGSMILLNMKKGDVFDDRLSYEAISLPKFKLARKERAEYDIARENMASFDLGGVFSTIRTLHDYFGKVSHAPCIAGIFAITVEIATSSNCTVSLEYASGVRNYTLCQMSAVQNARNTLKFNGILCLNLLHSVFFKSSVAANFTVLKNSVFSFVLLDSSANIEGFSVSQTANQDLRWPNSEKDRLAGKYRRLDNWNISSISFDSTFGFRRPFGTYIAQANGRYLATVNIILKAKLNCTLKIGLYKNGQYNPIAMVEHSLSNSSISTVSLVALPSVEKWDVLELKIAASLLTPLTVIDGSTFSVVLLDHDMSFQRCEANPLQLKRLYEMEITKRIGTDVVLNCTTISSKVVDFYWLRNNKVVHSILSSTEGTFVMKSASFDDSGQYVCRIQTGDFSVLSRKIEVIVYDPTPRISLVNQTLFIPEDSPPHQTLTEVYVQAATPHNTEDALVHLTIVPENMARIFYLSPDKTRAMARLKSRMPFDYEARNHYEFIIVATNIEFSGIANYSTKINVKIVDRNDNAPQFDKKSYSIDVLENTTIRTALLTLKAYDKDTGVNAKIEYSLHENINSKLFHIGKQSGILTLKNALDITQMRSLTLFVIATNEPFSTFCEVVVNVIDINDNRPYFKPSFYKINVTDTTELGASVAKIFAYDLDIEVKNRRITYKLRQPNEMVPFSVEESGNIRITKKLGRYGGQVFTVYAVAYDGHGLKSSNEATIVLRVVKTAGVPSFYSGLRFVTDVYQVTVREDVPIGTLLTTVKAYNPDNSYSLLRYIFVEPELRYNFTVSENSGEVRTSHLLDYEAQRNYSLTVFACDVDGISECTAARVDIDVTDFNDNSPEFMQDIYQAAVSENAENGSMILRVVATDADSGTFGGIRYSFGSINGMLPLSIGETDGIVRVSGSLKGIYPISLISVAKATDRGNRVGKALLEIKIVGNDSIKQSLAGEKAPEFMKSFYSVLVKEDTKVGQQLTSVKASTVNATNVRYILSMSEDEIFMTNPIQGGLYLQKQLDYEEKTDYDLYLIAVLRNDERLRSYTRIHVNVIDINDNRPVLFDKSHVTFVTGTLKPGRFVTKISAVDKDSKHNGQVHYSMNTNATIPEFSLDSTSGDLRVKQIGDRDKYVLSVRACDKGVPNLCDYGTVTIHISKDTFDGGLKSNLLQSNYTYAELEFTVDQYVIDDYERIRFIAQEVHFHHPYYNQYTQLPPVTWYDVYYRRSRGQNHLRRYIAAEKLVDFNKIGRAPRDVSPRSIKTLRFKYGSEEECGELWKADQICNGPLHPGTQYRFQLELKHKGSMAFLKTGFTKPYRTDPAVVKHLPVTTPDERHTFPFWIALIAVSAVLLLVLLFLLICCCCYRRKMHRRKKNRYEVAIQKDSSLDAYSFPWKTETESQELTVWFSEDSIYNGSIPHSNSATRVSKL